MAASMEKEYNEEQLIRIVQRCMVVPETPTPRQELFLSSLDLLWRPLEHMKMLHFYPTEQQDAFIATLRDGLARVLVPFYPAAGRFALSQQEGKHKGRICIDCSDAGVEFIVAAADTVDFLDLQAQSCHPCPLFTKFAPYGVSKPSSDFYSLPILAIQVTKLRCGRGVVLGIAHSHVLADAQSWCHFMTSWAQCARKLPIDMQPLHMRWALAVETPLKEKAFLSYPPESLINSISPAAVRHDQPLTELYFPLSGEDLQKLKEAANASLQGKAYYDDKPFTSYEALCAYWWKIVTQARQLNGNTVVKFSVLSNMRTRLTPKLPPAYFGNAIKSHYTYARAGEILQESLASTAARIRGSSTASSPESMWATIHWLELNGLVYDTKYINEHVPGIRIISSPRFPLYDADYGFGRPVAVRPVKVNSDGNTVLYPPRDGDSNGGVDIFLTISVETAKRLLQEESSLLISSSKHFSGFSKM